MATAKKAAKKKSAAKTAKKVTPPKAKKSAATKPIKLKARKPAVLPKSDGPAGVKAYIASMEPWQGAVAKRVHDLIAKEIPEAKMGIRWHCPFYGIEEQGWFLAFAAFQYHVKFTFFAGTSMQPPPPAGTTGKARSLDVREHDTLDEKQFAKWLQQAAALPGWAGY